MSARMLAAIAILAVAATGWTQPAAAHSWYPHECCHDRDCVPVDTATWIVRRAAVARSFASV